MITQIAIAVASVLGLFVVTWAARRLGNAFGFGAETRRKLVHVGVGLHAIVLPFILTRDGFLIFAGLALIALLVLRLPHFAKGGIGASLHGVERRSWGDILFLAAMVVLFVRSAGNPALYTLPIAVLTLSDAAAALVGTEYGRRRFGRDDRIKSIEGSSAFFVVTWMIVVSILIAATDTPRENVIWLATLVAAFATHVEAESWHGLDNLFVPVGIHVLMVNWGGAAPTALVAVTVVWLAMLLAADHFASRLGLTGHAGRAAAVALFLTATAADPVNAVLPIVAFVICLISRKGQALMTAEPILDFVAALVIVGVVWLTIGATFHLNAIAFYVATFVAIASGYMVLAVRDLDLILRLMVAVASVAATGMLFHQLYVPMTAGMGWTPHLPLAVIACLGGVLAAGAVALRPGGWLFNAPGPRLAALALAVLIPCYLYEVFA